jgi:hypothetical protein
VTHDLLFDDVQIVVHSVYCMSPISTTACRSTYRQICRVNGLSFKQRNSDIEPSVTDSSTYMSSLHVIILVFMLFHNKQYSVCCMFVVNNSRWLLITIQEKNN